MTEKETQPEGVNQEEQPKDIITFTPQQLEERDQRIKQASYLEGKDAGKEMTVKELKRMAGLDFEGKDESTFIKYFKEKIMSDAKVEPSKKIQELEQQNSGLIENLKRIEEDYRQKETTLMNKLSDIELNYMIESHIPDSLPQGLTKKDAAILYKNNYRIEKTEEGVKVYHGDKLMTDPVTLKPLDVSTTLSGFLKEKNLIVENKQGRGEQNNVTKQNMSVTNITDANTFYEYLRDNNIPKTGKEAVELYGKLPDDVRKRIQQRQE